MATKFGNGIDLDNNRIINLADPSNPTDAVNKQYTDALVRGLSWKQAVKAATTTNGSLSSAYEAGDTLDGVVLQAGDRILIKDQTDATENGIYIVQESGAPVRAPDADTGDDLRGATVTVQMGTVNADKVYRLITDNVTVGVTELIWTEIGGAAPTYSAGNGLVENPARVFNVGAGDGITVNSNSVALASTVAGSGLSYASGILNVNTGTGIVIEADAVAIDVNTVTRKMAANIGNGVATTFQVNHNLGTRDVEVKIRYNVAPFSFIETDVDATDPNYVTLTFAKPPASNEFRVIVFG